MRSYRKPAVNRTYITEYTYFSKDVSISSTKYVDGNESQNNKFLYT